jgi:hypothetical protein
MKYNLGTTQVKDSSGNWQYPSGAWIKQHGSWVAVENAYIKNNGEWERVYPIPQGVFSVNENFTHSYYSTLTDPGVTLIVTNSGDYDLTISSMSATDVSGYTTTSLTGSTNLPITIPPGGTWSVTQVVSGTTVGAYTGGSVTFDYNTGYLGTSSSTVPVTVNVLQPYASITATYPSISFTYQQYAGTNVYNTSSVEYTYTVPAGVSAIWVQSTGGGGGGGGTDSHGGYPGYSGDMVSGYLPVSTGQVVRLYSGSGGGPGANATEGGFAYGGYSALGYNGGTGGPSGYSGTSGAGGGGGAASVVTVNNTVTIVAGGGGGGGGGGNNGCCGWGRPQQNLLNSGHIAGQSGANRGGNDGGGPGAGGGGATGGAAGSLIYGDNGQYSGSNGTNLVPGTGWDWRQGSGNNGGGANSSAGGSGYFTFMEYRLVTGSAQTITFQNIGHGENLTISSVTSQNGYVAISSLSTSVAPGQTGSFVITPYTQAYYGTYDDVITINSNSTTNPSLTIPVTISVY